MDSPFSDDKAIGGLDWQWDVSRVKGGYSDFAEGDFDKVVGQSELLYIANSFFRKDGVL